MSNPWPLTPEPTWYLNSNWLQSGYNRNGVFYAGDTVVIPRTPKYLPTDPATADFELGSNGATITNTDAGSFTPFSSVFGSPTYDNTHVASGSLSMKIGASDSTSKVDWHPFHPIDGKTHAGRLRLYATANPTANVNLVVFSAVRATPPTICQLFVNTSGKLTINTGAFHAFSTAIPLNQFCRIEWRIVNDISAGSVTVRLYTGSNDSVPAETVTVTGLALQDISTNGFITQLGTTASTSWGAAFWLDDLVTNAADWVGAGAVTFPTLTHDYEIRDFYGDVVSSGSFNEYVCTPTPPAGGWPNGWYRFYVTGDQTDSMFGTSYGVTQFAVINNDLHFPPMPSGDTDGGADVSSDLVMKGVLGLGTSRLPVLDAADLTGSSYPMSSLLSDIALTKTYWTDPGSSYLDPNRPRHVWVNFPNRSVDYVTLAAATSGTYGRVYCKDETLDGSQIFVKVSAGTNPSTDKIQVYSPDNATLVETYDNLANGNAAKTAINGISAYIKIFGVGTTRAATVSATAVDKIYHDGVVSAVSQCYAAGATRFEGPVNEPNFDMAADECVQQETMFVASVHAGNASAKAIGPGCVDVASTIAFLNAGVGQVFDEISLHAYNSIDGDIHIGKSQLSQLETALSNNGLGSKVRWQTESTQGTSSIFVHVPHKNSRWFLWNMLLLEQYGLPRERNNPWYDKSHGFWSFPAYLRTSDGALTPQAVAGRVLAEETWGKPFDSAVDFGSPGGDMFIGNLYVDPDDGTSVVAVLPTSQMENGSVTFSIHGTSAPLTAVDTFGNQTTVHVSSGTATLDVTNLTAYLRLPDGVTATVASCNDWTSTVLTEVSRASASVGGTSTSKPIDNVYMASYDGSAGNAFISANSPPEDITVLFSGSETIDRVIVWSGFVWQNHCGLVKFDVQTTTNGTDWVTQTSVDRSADCVSFLFGAGTSNTGTSYESFYPEPWVFDVSFASVEATGVRIMVDQTTFGGMPDEQSGTGQFQDNGVWQPQHVTVQELRVFSGSIAAQPPPSRFEMGGGFVRPIERRKHRDDVIDDDYVLAVLALTSRRWRRGVSSRTRSVAATSSSRTSHSGSRREMVASR